MVACTGVSCTRKCWNVYIETVDIFTSSSQTAHASPGFPKRPVKSLLSDKVSYRSIGTLLRFIYLWLPLPPTPSSMQE